jgi:hypothetical protein
VIQKAHISGLKLAATRMRSIRKAKGRRPLLAAPSGG